MRAHPVTHASALVWSALVISCTFGGVGDYEIETCDVRVTSAAEDVCRRLESSDPCRPYQCAAGGTCMQAPRDADRDGDPDIACGGSDCDDTLREVSGIVNEVCDKLDNDCDGQLNEDVLTSEQPTEVDNLGALTTEQRNGVSISGIGWESAEMLGASVIEQGGQCIRVVRLPGGAAAGCTLLSSEDDLSPLQPYAQKMDSQTGAVFVSVSNCAHGRLMYRVGPNPANTAGNADQACADADPGAALPSFAPIPDSAQGLVAWYRADVRQRDERYGACADATPASLVAAVMSGVRTGSPSLGAPIELAAEATSVAPPAVIPVASPAGALLLSAVGAGAGAWWFPGELVEAKEPAAIPGFEGARAVSAATRVADGMVHLLALGEIGCLPQSLKLALGTLDSSGALAFEQAFELVPSQAGVLVGRPAAAWIASLSEWRVTWVTSGPKVMAQRFEANGTKVGGPFEVAPGASLAAPASDGTVFAFETSGESNIFWEVPIGCGG